MDLEERRKQNHLLRKNEEFLADPENDILFGLYSQKDVGALDIILKKLQGETLSKHYLWKIQPLIDSYKQDIQGYKMKRLAVTQEIFELTDSDEEDIAGNRGLDIECKPIKYKYPRRYAYIPILTPTPPSVSVNTQNNILKNCTINYSNLIEIKPSPINFEAENDEQQFVSIEEEEMPLTSSIASSPKVDSSGYSTESSKGLSPHSKINGNLSATINASKFPVVKKCEYPGQQKRLNYYAELFEKRRHEEELRKQDEDAKRKKVEIATNEEETPGIPQIHLDQVNVRLTKTGKIFKNPTPKGPRNFLQRAKLQPENLSLPPNQAPLRTRPYSSSPLIPSEFGDSSGYSSPSVRMSNDSNISEISTIPDQFKAEEEQVNINNEIYKGDAEFSDTPIEEANFSNIPAAFLSHDVVKDEPIELTDVIVDPNASLNVGIKREYSDNDSTDIEDPNFYNDDSSAESEEDINERIENRVARLIQLLEDDEVFIRAMRAIDNTDKESMRQARVEDYLVDDPTISPPKTPTEACFDFPQFSQDENKNECWEMPPEGEIGKNSQNDSEDEIIHYSPSISPSLKEFQES